MFWARMLAYIWADSARWWNPAGLLNRRENPNWGQARVAAELSVKLGIYVSRRTVRVYWPAEPEPRGNGRTPSRNWRAGDSATCYDYAMRNLVVFFILSIAKTSTRTKI
jgi:hypothetical protein